MNPSNNRSLLPGSSRANNTPPPADTDAGKYFDASSEEFPVPVTNDEDYFDASDDESWLLPPVEKGEKENVARPVAATMTAGRRIARPIAPRMARRRAIAVAAAKNRAAPPPAQQSPVPQQQSPLVAQQSIAPQQSPVVAQQPPQQMPAPPQMQPKTEANFDTDELMPSVVSREAQSPWLTPGSSFSSVPCFGTPVPVAVAGSVTIIPDDPMEIDGPEFQAIDSLGDQMDVDLFRPALAREIGRIFGFSAVRASGFSGLKKPTRLSCRLDVRSVRCGSLVGGSSWTAKMAVRRRSRLASRHKVGSSSRRVSLVACAGRKT